MKKKIQIPQKGFKKSLIPVVLIAVLFSVSFNSCQKDESILNASPADGLIQNGQLKSASISVPLIDDLISKINGYVSSGDLETGIANALISKLENAKKSLDKGNDGAATNQLQAVANQLDGLVGAGQLDSTIGEGLIFDLQALTGENPTYTDPRDGKVYKTIKIGDQVWMAENLAYLPTVSEPIETSLSYPYYFVNGYYGTNTADAKATDNYKTYGALYNWPAAKEACPEGWHLPSDAEWTQLENYLTDNGYGYEGSGDDIAKALAATTNWYSSTTPGTPGDNLLLNNSSGFSALPGGYINSIRDFIRTEINGSWWSATESGIYNASTRRLFYSSSIVNHYIDIKANGLSVRCIRDN